jgi:hypothetical protein
MCKEPHIGSAPHHVTEYEFSQCLKQSAVSGVVNVHRQRVEFPMLVTRRKSSALIVTFTVERDGDLVSQCRHPKPLNHYNNPNPVRHGVPRVAHRFGISRIRVDRDGAARTTAPLNAA